MKEEVLSTREQIQTKYNQLVGLLGHQTTQKKIIEREIASLEVQIDKLLKKANHLPKEEPKTTTLETEAPVSTTEETAKEVA